MVAAWQPSHFQSSPLPVRIWHNSSGHWDRLAKVAIPNRTEPKAAGQWIRYMVAAIALWLVVWMLRISGINVL
jgi:hypothetical protein